MNYKELPDKELLRQTRQNYGISQVEMASRMGYSTKYAVLDVEKGRKKLSGPARKLLEILYKRSQKS